MGHSVDFFVSYTSADRPWAEWIAWELEHAGHTTLIQAWDMQPGSNFVLEMHAAARVAERIVAVLSPAFLESPYCSAEWAAAFATDPGGNNRSLVPVRVRRCNPDGLLGQIVYIDVVGLNETASRRALLDGVDARRAKPADAPRFPGRPAEDGTRARARRPESGAVIFNVPVMTRAFVGRTKQLERLRGGLADSGSVAITQVHAIHGMGGVGKTQLAARYARTHRDDYDVVWWLRAEQPPTLLSDLADLAAALGLMGTSNFDEHDAVLAARDWLDHHGRWLIVFDNATGPDAIADLVPEGTAGHVLITSRAHADWRRLQAEPLALDVWERRESLEFLRARTGESNDVVLEAVAVALGDLPLALEQASAYASCQAISLTKYLHRLRARAPELFAAGQPLGYEHTIKTVWSLAFDQIAEDPVASALLEVCAQLAPERIPRDLLDAWGEGSGAGAASDVGVDEAVELLLSYAVLTVGDEQTLGMHRLVGQIVRASASPEQRGRAATAAVSLLDRVMPRQPWDHEQWPAYERLLAHALIATQNASLLSVAQPETARLLARIGQYQLARPALASAKEVTARALAISEAIYGPTHPEVAVVLDDLGSVLRHLGESAAAREAFERALAIKEASYGPEHPDVALTLARLGSALADLGELRAARAAQQRALEIEESVYGLDHPGLAGTLGDLGNVLRLLGEFEAARETQERALTIKEAVHGPAHPYVAGTLSNLGLVLLHLGEFEASRDAQQRALAINEGAYGPEHPDVATALSNLGLALQRLGALAAAHDAYERALAINEAVYGSEHPHVATTLSNLGSALEQLGEFAAARDAQQRALEINEAVHGPEHPDVARVLGNLGNVLRRLREFGAARQAYERALMIKEAVYGPRHPEIAVTLTNLAVVLGQMGEHDAASVAARRAVAIFDVAYGPGHTNTVHARSNLAALLRDSG